MNADVSYWRKMIRLVLQRPKVFVLPLLAGGIVASMNVPALWLMRFALDFAGQRGNLVLIVAAAAGILLCRAVSAGVIIASARITLPLARQIVARLRIDMHARLSRLRWIEYATINRGTVHARLVHDPEKIEQLLAGLICSSLPALLPLLVYLAGLFWIAWPLAVVVLAAAVLSRVPIWYAARLHRGAVARYYAGFERFHVGAQRSLMMLPMTRTQGTDKEDGTVFAGLAGHLSVEGARLSLTGAATQQASAFSASVLSVSTLVAGGMWVMEGGMSVGTLAVFVLAANLISASIGSIGAALPLLMAAEDAAGRIAQLDNWLAAEDRVGSIPVRAPADLFFDCVSFAHGGRRIIDNQSLQIERGLVTAIAAPNGAGKTTFLDLAAGLLPPEAGRIFVSGHDMATVDRVAWRRSLGYLRQNPVMFPGTLRENICFGRGLVDEAQLACALRLSTLEELLERLPGGLDTVVGDDGLKMSGGEMQRVALARALLNDPALLVLDEPSNHLDEAAVFLFADRLRNVPGRTILMATHDPRLLVKADRIYDLADGRLTLRDPRNAKEGAL